MQLDGAQLIDKAFAESNLLSGLMLCEQKQKNLNTKASHF